MSIPRSAPFVPPPAARFERLSKIRLCFDLCDDDDETDDDYCQITAEVINIVVESQTTAEVVHVDESQARITEDSDVEEVMGLWFPADMLDCPLEGVSVCPYIRTMK